MATVHRAFSLARHHFRGLPVARSYHRGNLGQDVYIVSAARTPIGSFRSSLSALSASKLGSIAISAAVERAGVSPEQVSQSVQYSTVLKQRR